MQLLAVLDDKMDSALTELLGSLSSVGLRPYLRIRNPDGSWDLAIADGGRRTIIRLLASRSVSATFELAGMIESKDFDRAVMVQSDGEGRKTESQIEVWPVADLDALAASLSGRTS